MRAMMAAALAAPLPALADGAVYLVPSAVSPGSGFTVEGETGAGGLCVPTAPLVARGNGARLVVDGRVAVAATDGARLGTGPRDPSGAPTLVLLSGTHRVTAGSLPVVVSLGRGALEVRDAAIAAGLAGGTWIVEVLSIADKGRVESRSQPGAAMAAGQGLGMTTDGAVAPAGAAELAALVALADRLVARPAPIRLEPANVEDPADLRPSRRAAEGSGEAVEIEAIEVEIGCVEVCVD